jgi:hypothetical protein
VPNAQWKSGDDPTGGVWLKVTLREGRKRQIRRMAALEGMVVRRLIRIRIGPLTLDRSLAPGQYRPLTRAEVQRLRARVGSAGKGPGSRRSRRTAQGGRRSRGTGSGRPSTGRLTGNSPAKKPSRKRDPRFRP